MNAESVVKAAMGPAEKLIDAVSGAIGKAYEPRHIRKIADSKAYELRVIGEELRNNSDLPIKYNISSSFSIDISDYEELAKRAGKRIAYQEVVKQENIESIVDDAYNSIKDIDLSVEGDISREWMNRFIDSAGNVSTEDMQKIWSKILAGEVLNPSSFSLRTLECLRNMDVRDAQLFEKLCSIVISNNFVINDSAFLEKHGITYNDILSLDEGGLLNSSGMIVSNFEINEEPETIIDFGEYVLIGKSESKKILKIQQFPLTMAGEELSRIISGITDINVIKEICLLVAKKNSSINMSLHKIISRKDDGFFYEDKSLI